MYEGYPRFYDKRMVTVRDGLGRELSAMVYVMDEQFRKPMLPSHDYYNGILRGYLRFDLPVTALKKAWDNTVQEIHQETERINAKLSDRVKSPKRRQGHDR